MSLITVLLMLLTIYFSISSAGRRNYISPLTLSSETQATGSDVTVFVNATFRDSFGQISWFIGNRKNVVGVVQNDNSTIQILYPESQYRNRIRISAHGNFLTIQSQMIITSLQKNENLQIGVIRSGLFYEKKLTMLHVTDCPKSLGSNLVVFSSNPTYNKSGTFRCSNDGELVYFNNSRKESNSTICSQDATWNGQENLECWNAPSVQLHPANITGKEGNVMPMSCQAIGGYPLSYTSYYFVFSGDNITQLSGSIYIQLKKEWNQKEAYCKAITNYTVSNDKGKSSPIKMNVQYRPQSVSASVLIQTNSQIINSSYDLYLSSGQSLSVSCSSDSNPRAACEWFQCSSKCSKISSNCEETLTIDVAGTLYCSAVNLLGSEHSTNISLFLVPSNRSFNITDSSGLIPPYISRKIGTVISLHCSIDFDDVLMTTYSWNIHHLTGNYNVDNRSIEVELSREDIGNYTCNADDDFTSYSETVRIDVLYAPFADDNSEVKCEWSLNELNPVCDVPFYSNPAPLVVTLMKGDMDLTGPLYQVRNTDVKDRYIFSLQRRIVLEEDFGQYIVTVNNFMYIGTIQFSVVQSTSLQVNVGVIVGSVFGSFAAVALIAVGINVVRRHQAKRTKDGKPKIKQDGKPDSIASPSPVVHINAPGTETVHVQDHTGGNSVTFNQQAAATDYENVHHYEAVGPKKQDGGEDLYIDFNI